MTEKLLLGLTSVVVLGIGAKWFSWRLHLPSILVLLLVGFFAGWIGIIDPDLLFGDLLLPIVSLSVALILFEGGMSLRRKELVNAVWKPLRNLISVGVGVSWLILTVAGTYLLEMDWMLSALLGAILVVSGPTVIGPLIRQIRPTPQVSNVLKWEGIMIDPVGVMLAVLVFSVIAGEVPGDAPMMAVWVVLKTVIVGSALGIFGGMSLASLLRRHIVPDYLQNPFTLMYVLFVFAVSNELQHESGLLAVTCMGIVLANQTQVSVRHIIEFKENLRVLIISSLFILLAARIRVEDLASISWQGYAYLAVVVLLARPIAVAISTWGSELNWRERVFLAWMAPRGIVAAALSSILATDLLLQGHEEAAVLVPMTFLVIFATVVFCGLTARPIAKALGLAQDNPQGIVILGAHSWARSLALQLQQHGCAVLVADTNRNNVEAAERMGLPTYCGDVLTEHSHDEIDLSSMGRFLALTPNEEINTLACLHFSEEFGRSAVFQVGTTPAAPGSLAASLGGRRLFGPEVTYELLQHRTAVGGEMKDHVFVPQGEASSRMDRFGAEALPLFSLGDNGKVNILTTDSRTVDPGARVLGQVLEPQRISIPF